MPRKQSARKGQNKAAPSPTEPDVVKKRPARQAKSKAEKVEAETPVEAPVGSRAKRSSTAAQTAASAADSRSPRGRGRRGSSASSDNHSVDAGLDTPRSRARSQRATKKVSYVESEGEDEEPQAKTGPEEEYNADEDPESDSGDSLSRRAKGKQKVVSPPVRSPRSRGRVQSKAKTPRSKRAKKSKYVDEDEEEEEEEADQPDTPKPTAPSRRGRYTEPATDESEDEAPKKGKGEASTRASRAAKRQQDTPKRTPAKATTRGGRGRKTQSKVEDDAKAEKPEDEVETVKSKKRKLEDDGQDDEHEDNKKKSKIEEEKSKNEEDEKSKSDLDDEEKDDSMEVDETDKDVEKKSDAPEDEDEKPAEEEKSLEKQKSPEKESSKIDESSIEDKKAVEPMQTEKEPENEKPDESCESEKSDNDNPVSQNNDEIIEPVEPPKNETVESKGKPVENDVQPSKPIHDTKPIANDSDQVKSLPSNQNILDPPKDGLKTDGEVVNSNGLHDIPSVEYEAVFRGRKYVLNPHLGDDLRSRCYNRTFGVVSYNLAGEAPRPLENFVKSIRTVNSELVCLQGVTEVLFRGYLETNFESWGYKGLFSAVPEQNIGFATFYKVSSFQMKSMRPLHLKQTIVQDIERTLVAEDGQAVLRRLPTCGNALLVHLTHTGPSDRNLTVANIDIPPTDLSVQALEVSCLMRETLQFLGGTNDPVILCGAFNMKSSDASYQLLQDGYLSEEMIEALQGKKDIKLPGKDENTSLLNVLWKAFQHSATGMKSCYATALDAELLPSISPEMIWVSSNSLHTLGVLDANEKQDQGLHSSNHLLLKSDIAFNL